MDSWLPSSKQEKGRSVTWEVQTRRMVALDGYRAYETRVHKMTEPKLIHLHVDGKPSVSLGKINAKESGRVLTKSIAESGT
jgi:hypothetical protein